MDNDKPMDLEYSQEIFEAYANNVLYESSVWDLKFNFGQLNQTGGKNRIAFHSSITVPWAQAKLMLYWLRAQVEAHELTIGKIEIPKAVLPPPPPPLTEEIKKADPTAEVVFKLFRQLREEFLAEQEK